MCLRLKENVRSYVACFDFFTVTTVWLQNIAISVSVCLFVCLSARMYKKPKVQISPYFSYMLPSAVARSFSDGNGMCYVVSVLIMLATQISLLKLVQIRPRRERFRTNGLNITNKKIHSFFYSSLRFVCFCTLRALRSK